MEFLEAGEQIHVLDGQGSVHTCKTRAEFTKLCATIPGMALVDKSHDEPLHSDDMSHPSGSADHRLQPEPDVSEPILDSDITDVDYDSRKSGDTQSYFFLFHVFPTSVSVVYLILLILTEVSLKFLS